MKKLSKDKLVIMVTHGREFAQEYADRIIELKDDEIVNDTSNSELEKREQPDIQMKKMTLPYKSSLRFTLNSLFLRKKRLLFMLILFMLSLTFVYIGTSFTFYNIHTETINTFEKADLRIIPLIQYSDQNDGYGFYNIESFTSEEISNYQNNYPDMHFLKSIYGSSSIGTFDLFSFPFAPATAFDATSFDKFTIINNTNQTSFPLLYGNYLLNTDDD